MSALVPKKAITDQVRDCVITLAYVYGVDVLSMQNIVLGAVTEMQTIDTERLRKGARDWYQFENGQALPVLSERVQPHLCTYDERERAFIARGDVNKATRGNLAKTTIERDFWWCRGNESGLADR